MAVKKPVKKPVAMMPGRNGGRLRRGGTKGNTPGTGRPPDAFKAMCRDLASSAEVEKVVRQVLKNAKHPAFVGALKWATEHGYGKPNQPVAIEGFAQLGAAMLAAEQRLAAERANAKGDE